MAATVSSDPDTGWENSPNEQHHSLVFAAMEMAMMKENSQCFPPGAFRSLKTCHLYVI